MKPSHIFLLVSIILVHFSCDEPSKVGLIHNTVLSFSGDFQQPFTIDMDGLKAMPVQSVLGKDKDEQTYEFQGVWLRDLIQKAGIEFGTGLKGKNQSQYILTEASDGYKSVFSLPEIDPEFSGKQILVAYARAGEPLGEGVGPFRIIVPEENLHARWVRQLVSVKLVKIE
ncbi:molybdopterin-dependent oxidoreductase [Mongoliibacter ruber]|uniref:Molybdopterin-dependent oxidoreductase-like protein n=1 Tax=Mongoliibacter ruber TaxID=1750599 RepID=A0A2T0WG58_9BACT|nr:molybdopterin-dependent oxidoreductase [Mongoliibacter ruber]PRY85504.1 molybdopterin-dependent oxidoreductase-like protein [Mongoliibacter ruber]